VRFATFLATALALPALAAGPTGEATGPPASPATPAAPGPTSSAAVPPVQAFEVARALLPQERWNTLLDGYASSLATGVSRSLGQKGKAVPDGLQARLRTELGQALPYQQTIDAQARALAKGLSRDDLAKAAAFYASPAGKKILDRLPAAQEEVSDGLQARLSEAVPRIVQRVAPEALAPGAGGEMGGPDGHPSTQGRRPGP
jgi:hypothetical protein